MNPISDTAYICAGFRMLDAESSNPVCCDTYAKYFMNEHGQQIFEKFKHMENHRIGNLTRHRIIDDLLKEKLRDHPGATVILIGAGFDTRAFRLDGGNWVEVDEPQIIEYKNSRLPIDNCRNSLTRISHKFSSDSLEQYLDQYKNNTIIVVVEGVFRYLDLDAINNLIYQLQKLFPEHQLVCDLMNQKFHTKYASLTKDAVRDMDAPFKFVEKKPEHVFQKCGYQIIKKISVMDFVFKSGFMKNPGILPELFQRTLLYGYSIFHFHYS